MNKNIDNYLNILRHSSAHLLAAAVLELYPDAKNTIGPSIEDGFYYDFDFGQTKISDGDLPKIEAKMIETLSSWKNFEKIDVTAEEVKKKFADNLYKLELINELEEKNEPITIYKSGSFEDLCRGGHIENPKKEIKAFKLLSVAGAYWRGSEKNKMLTRIYGTSFPTKEELDKYLELLEEAKKRDHRKIGEQQNLFAISEDVGLGLILWLPKGNIIKEEIENFTKKTEQGWGYQRVTTPHITKSGLYYTSGHLPYYKDDMYPSMKLDKDEEYFLKPMNCPHHHKIFAARPHSYKELPIRLAEFGTCYRYESSGELFGLMRVRGFTQNDSHIYCTLDQAIEEFVNVMKLHEYYYKVFDIKEYHLELALRDPKKKNKYHGDDKMWKLAEKLMREAVAKTKIKMVEEVGSAAFYGPKIDFIVKSSIGREFAISTNQIDLYMGERFELKYIDSEGKGQTPVIIHRAPLGSHERFIGFLIEHYGGIFPVWLSPVQVVVLPISDRNLEYSEKVADKLKVAGIRAELDSRSETLQSKIRDAQIQKVPYMLVVGNREEEAKTVAVRLRTGEDLGSIKLEEFITRIAQIIAEKNGL